MRSAPMCWTELMEIFAEVFGDAGERCFRCGCPGVRVNETCMHCNERKWEVINDNA